ncbi:MAG: peroxiredoxin [Rhodospirillales bacterium]|nr:peroxiredoxin [Rhodospirillales bacterium]
MTISVGDSIPAATLRFKDSSGVQQTSTGDLFKGKTVVMFAVPGAFTPTCSAKHLPGFVQNADAIRAKGVDAIICVSVNDPFVMSAWGDHQKVGDKVMMMADGNAEFAAAMGLDFDASGPGLGTRCRRFSMVAEDGIVKTLNIEEPGAFDISSAETILSQL